MRQKGILTISNPTGVGNVSFTIAGEPVVSTIKISLTGYGCEDDATGLISIKFGSAPTSEYDYDYKTNHTTYSGRYSLATWDPSFVNPIDVSETIAYVFSPGRTIVKYILNGVETTVNAIKNWDTPLVLNLTDGDDLTIYAMGFD